MFSGVRSLSNRMRLGFAVLVVLALSLSAPLGASAAGLGGGVLSSSAPALTISRAANIVWHISLTPRSANILLVSQPVTMAFNYNTTWGMGVIVTAVPFTGTAATVGATGCKTAVLPVGHGTGTCTFSVATAGVVVNALHWQMWDSTAKTILFDAMLPVNYQISNAANLVSGLIISPEPPSIQVLGKGVSVKFSYKTNQAGGVRVFAVPFTGTAPTPNYVTCASTIYAVGSGTGTCRFTVASGAVNVTSVHLEMWNAAQSTMLAQVAIPAAYAFRNLPTLVTHPSFSPNTPNIVRLGVNAVVHFDYQTNQTAGIIVQAIPYTGGVPTAGATLTASALLPMGTGTGKGSAAFMLTGSSTTVNIVRLNVWNSTRTVLLFAVYLPVQYQFH